MRYASRPLKGQLHRIPLESKVLKGNPLGDPTQRELLVYTPPGYDESQNYPLFVDLAAYTSSGPARINWKPFGLSMPQRIDALISNERIGPVVTLFPDCYTSYGGNQYINSTAVGSYQDYLYEELLPAVESKFAVDSDPRKRAVFGKSSGGYGAMVQGLINQQHWGAVGCLSGDAYFEYAYLNDMPLLLRTLQRYEGSVRAFLEAVWSKEKIRHDEGMTLMLLGLAAHYDPDPEHEHGFQLPVNLHTGEIRWDRWENWLKHDPVRLVESHADNLKNLQGVYLECGTTDQFHLLWGARILHEKMTNLQIEHEYVEFNDNHSDLDYRLDVALPFLYKAISDTQ